MRSDTFRSPTPSCLDGDHNYYTLINELRLIAERAEDIPAAGLP